MVAAGRWRLTAAILGRAVGPSPVDPWPTSILARRAAWAAKIAFVGTLWFGYAAYIRESNVEDESAAEARARAQEFPLMLHRMHLVDERTE